MSFINRYIPPPFITSEVLKHFFFTSQQLGSPLHEILILAKDFASEDESLYHFAALLER